MRKSTIVARCASNNFKNWYFTDDEYQQKTIDKLKNNQFNRNKRDREYTLVNKSPIISINGENFYSFKEARDTYKIGTRTIQRKCLNNNEPNWIFLNLEDFEKYVKIHDKILKRERARIRPKKK